MTFALQTSSLPYSGMHETSNCMEAFAPHDTKTSDLELRIYVLGFRV